MNLKEQINNASKEIFKDGYEMSIGEMTSLYTNGEIVIQPEYQRLYRWKKTQKIRFIESILLGIPIPPFFVYQDENGIWELIDGLQRLSTLLEFMGIILEEDGPLVLEGTQLLPGLDGIDWSNLDASIQRDFKRSRIRLEILKKESDPLAKYELFQRLNTGGTRLREQEVRNASMIMINKTFYDFIKRLSEKPFFRSVADISENEKKQQRYMELVLRYFVTKLIPYNGKLDVNEYLDEGMGSLATNPGFNYLEEENTFDSVFELLDRSLGKKAFKKYENGQSSGKFLLAAYEGITKGVTENLAAIKQFTPDQQVAFIIDRVSSIYNQREFTSNSGGGVRGTTRLSSVLDFGKVWFKP